MIDTAEDHSLLTTLTADIVSAHVANNSVAVPDVSALIGNVYAALAGLGKVTAPAAPPCEPAVSIRASVKPDYLVCLEDGKKLKMLKRHLMTHYQMTPEDYRTKWHLPATYPMVAPAYAEKRRTFAKQIGLGRKRKAASSVTDEPQADPVVFKRRDQRKKTDTPADAQ